MVGQKELARLNYARAQATKKMEMFAKIEKVENNVAKNAFKALEELSLDMQNNNDATLITRMYELLVKLMSCGRIDEEDRSFIDVFNAVTGKPVML